MADIIPIREGVTTTEKEFCQKIDELVEKFNKIAAQEILEPRPKEPEPTDLESLKAVNAKLSQNFQEDLKKTTLPVKIDDLKNVFSEIADLGMDALRDLQINGPEFKTHAIDRIVHVLDVMNDDESDYAPELVRSDAIIKDEQWASLKQHRDEISNQLRAQLDILYAPL